MHTSHRAGLDSIAALKIITMLHSFCAQGMMVLCTMHQPRLAIWRLVSKVLVLSKGRQLFFGPPAVAEQWFTTGLDLTIPPDTTPVDFIVDQVNIDFGDKAGIYGEDYQQQQQQQHHHHHQLVTIEDIDEVGVGASGLTGAPRVGDPIHPIDRPRAHPSSFPSLHDPVQVAVAFRQQHPDVYAAASVAARPIEGRSIPQPSSGVLEGAADWWFKFRLLLQQRAGLRAQPGQRARAAGHLRGRGLAVGHVFVQGWLNSRDAGLEHHDRYVGGKG